MDACIFVIIQQWKNDFRKKKKQPPFWIGVGLISLYLLYCIYQLIVHFGKNGAMSNGVRRFQGLSIMVFMFFSFVALLLGIVKGNTWFTKADINLMFVSPISPTQELLYGMLRRLIVSVPITLILLTQLPNIHYYFGVSALDLLILVLTWLLLIFSLTILSIAIYSATAMHPSIRKLILIAMFFCGGVVIAGAVAALWRSGTNLGGVLSFFTDSTLHIVPLGGWAAGFLVNMMNGQVYQALIYLALLLVMPIIGMALIALNSSDYYEEVLTSIGHGYGILHKTGDQNDGRQAPRKWRSHLFGLSSGEVALMQRRITEQSKGTFLLMDRISVIMFGVAVFLGAVMHVFMRKGMYPFIMEVITLGVLSYVSIFTLPAERFVDELQKPFIFLMPGKPVKKLLFASAAPMLKCLIESALCLTIVSILAQLPASFVFYGAIFQSSAIFLYCAAYVASVRTLGLNHSEFARKLLALAVVSAIFMFEMSLGINIGHELYIASTTIFVIVFLFLAVCNLIAAMVFFSSAKSILEYRD
ncbi:MAG: hypothetical protein J5750_04350 [Clostridiales bacterium]|nr:hypothetical protein [Clostridiales bacterium]